jgi:hypothetical protein
MPRDADIEPFRPLVIGAPRTGFALLASVLIRLAPLAPVKGDLRQIVVNRAVTGLGEYIAHCIVGVLNGAGIDRGILYNPNFRSLLGGPKWLVWPEGKLAGFRKYVGVRGMGDMMLITRHPREVLDADTIVHSHNDPEHWPDHPGYAGYRLFASLRNPIGVVNSSCFSLNALASEYLQRFYLPHEDTDRLRQALALWKMSDPAFFAGLLRFYADWFRRFIPVRERYAVMRWEDLILNPVETVQRVAADAGFAVSRDFAADLWHDIDHVNLTGAHLHNYRRGKGIVGDWANWIVNEHLDMFREHGFEQLNRELGYGPIEPLDEDEYTPFQRLVSRQLRRSVPFPKHPDPDLFGYAFNKSNIDASGFAFRSTEWREWTRIERSDFADPSLEARVWDAAEAATARINALFYDLLELPLTSEGAALAHLDRVRRAHEVAIGVREGVAYTGCFDGMAAAVRAAFKFGRLEDAAALLDESPSRLLRSGRSHNLVYHCGWYYVIAHAAGPLDLAASEEATLAGMWRTRWFDEAECELEVQDGR